jgi:type I restriction enzyme, S subunit
MAGEWREVVLEELATDLTVGFVGPMALEYVEAGIPFLRSQNVEPFRINSADIKFISPAFHARLKKSALLPGDVVIVRTGKPGACAVIPESLTDSNCADLVIIRCGPKLDPYFLMYYVNSAAIHHVDSCLVGAVQQHFNVGSARLMELLLPEIQEQRSIAHILGTLDDKIELNRKMNETLEAMARALFKSWFVDFDPVRAKMEGRWRRGESLPGLPAHLFDLFPDSFVDSELGEIPKGWQALPLYDLATYVNGAAYMAFQPNDDRRGLPIIKIAELKAGVTSQTKFSEVEMPEKYRLRTGDILFSWSGSPNTSIDTFVWAHGPAWLNQHIFRVDPCCANERSFVLATLKLLRPEFAEIARNKQTTGLGHVTVGDMQRLLVVKPNALALAAWNREAAPLFDAVFQNEQEALTLSRLRDTLLPVLLSGELSVGGAERALEARA